MAQYIDKSAVVAEIEKLKGKVNDHDAYSNGWQHALRTAEISINSLEVKEVDLEEEIDRVWDNTSDNFSEDGWKEFEDIAKHFFELGLKAQKGE